MIPPPGFVVVDAVASGCVPFAACRIFFSGAFAVGRTSKRHKGSAFRPRQTCAKRERVSVDSLVCFPIHQRFCHRFSHSFQPVVGLCAGNPTPTPTTTVRVERTVYERAENFSRLHNRDLSAVVTEAIMSYFSPEQQAEGAHCSVPLAREIDITLRSPRTPSQDV
jgi:hypothetical protein